MNTSDNHRKLIAWQEAISLVELVYCATASFPRHELFGVSAQIRRSAVSIPSNIAEGAARNSTRELVQFLGIASGSRAELDTQLEIASRLGLIRPDSKIFIQMERVGRLLTALRKSLQARLEAHEA
jgi:four helix bundle protein